MGQRSYDLDYLQRIHQHLFQNVYEWAGDLRTAGIEKGGESVCPPGNINQAMNHVVDEIHRHNKLKDVPNADLALTIAYLYDYVNFTHPFREATADPLASSSTYFCPNVAPDSTGLKPIWTSCTARAMLRGHNPTSAG